MLMKPRRRFQPLVTPLEARIALTGGDVPPADPPSDAAAPPGDESSAPPTDQAPEPDEPVASGPTIPTPHETAFVWRSGKYVRVPWMQLHEQFLAQSSEPRERPEVVFFGDSILYDWIEVGDRSWSPRLDRFQPANYAIAGDLTQNLLWRLEHGELAARPRIAVVMIGVNNLRVGDSVDDTAAGILANVRTIRRLAPETRVLLLGVLPTRDETLNQQVADLNTILGRKAPALGARFLDLTERFQSPGGRLRGELMRDDLHLSKAGFRAIAGPVAIALRRIEAAELARQLAVPSRVTGPRGARQPGPGR